MAPWTEAESLGPPQSSFLRRSFSLRPEPGATCSAHKHDCREYNPETASFPSEIILLVKCDELGHWSLGGGVFALPFTDFVTLGRHLTWV